MSPETAAALARGDAPKGDVLGTARIAGIGAAKRTGELIPLAHPLALDFVDVEGAVDVDAGLVTLSAEAGMTARTGVEMEAMTACAVAALTVYDMVKGLERGVSIEAIELVAQERRAQRRVEEGRVSRAGRGGDHGLDLEGPRRGRGRRAVRRSPPTPSGSARGGRQPR